MCTPQNLTWEWEGIRNLLVDRKNEELNQPSTLQRELLCKDGYSCQGNFAFTSALNMGSEIPSFSAPLPKKRKRTNPL